MDKRFDPAQIESKWYQRWEQLGCFQPPGHGAPYCILLPPPNVTGTLHMGHAFQQTIMDALIRYHRMRGDNTLWQVGTDHAGIATQKIVENRLAAEGKSRNDLGREAFIERIWQWKRDSGSSITRQMRRLGAAADWSRERFTMDAGLSDAVRRVFVTWYRAGLIYRGNRLVNWDPLLMTAVSDLEVNNVERDGSMWYICYPFSDGPVDGLRGMTIATTRPETMLADGALAVHPDDERFRHLVGRYVDLPLCDRKIPIIADEYVDRAFGSGCVKITGAHDFNDYQVAKRHAIDLIIVMTLDARMNDSAPRAYRGMDRYQARKAVVADLERYDYLIKVEPHKYQVPVSQRSDAVIEPMLTDQWFVDLTRDTLDDGRPGGRRAITEPALEAVRKGDIRFVPQAWTSTYTQWLDNIQDWCISRQLWWGHRIPAWYDQAGNLFVGEDEADARVHADAQPVGSLRQDEDVLDTWFSSALWPFSTLGWPSDQPVKNQRGTIVASWPADQAFLPTAVLVTGFDIIFFWVARMVMTTLYFTGKTPFREVYVNAIVRDAEGQKMSKSKGNTLDPLDLIDGIGLPALVQKSTQSLLIPQVRDKVERRIRQDYPDGIAAIGTDALRFTFAALASYSRTINFDLKRAEGYKAFCNKLWNAARFVLLNVEPFPPRETSRGEDTDPALGIVPRAFEPVRTATGSSQTPALTPGGEEDRESPRLGTEPLSHRERGRGEGTQTPGRPQPSSSPVGPAPPEALRGALLPERGDQPATEAERWILSRLHATLAEAEQHFASYRFDHLAQTLYEFVWNDYCDWFLELSKPALHLPEGLTGNAAATKAAASTRHTLVLVLEAALRALHPIIPFITEEIWHELISYNAGGVENVSPGSILERPYPRADKFSVDRAASAEIEWLQQILTGVRRIRSEMRIAPGVVIPLLWADGNAADRERAKKFGGQIEFLARCEPPRWLPPDAAEPVAAVAPVGDLRVLIPLAGLIDLDAERSRIGSEIARIEREIGKCNHKLGNTKFVEHAPSAVVELERTRLADWNAQLRVLHAQATRLQE